MAQLDPKEYGKVMITLRTDDVAWNQETFNYYAVGMGLVDRMWVYDGVMNIIGRRDHHARVVHPGDKLAMTHGAKHCLSAA